MIAGACELVREMVVRGQPCLSLQAMIGSTCARAVGLFLATCTALARRLRRLQRTCAYDHGRLQVLVRRRVGLLPLPHLLSIPRDRGAGQDVALKAAVSDEKFVSAFSRVSLNLSQRDRARISTPYRCDSVWDAESCANVGLAYSSSAATLILCAVAGSSQLQARSCSCATWCRPRKFSDLRALQT